LRDGTDHWGGPVQGPVKKRGEDDTEKRCGETRVPFRGPEDHRPNYDESKDQRLEVGSQSTVEISQKLLRGGFGSGSFDAEEVVDLTDEDDEGDARCETADDGRRDEGDEASEAQETDDEQERAREQARDPDAFESVALHQHDQHRGHRAGGSTDLKGCAGESADNETRQNGCDQPRRGGCTRSDPERQRKRKRDRGNGETCEQVLLKFGE